MNKNKKRRGVETQNKICVTQQSYILANKSINFYNITTQSAVCVNTIDTIPVPVPKRTGDQKLVSSCSTFNPPSFVKSSDDFIKWPKNLNLNHRGPPPNSLFHSFALVSCGSPPLHHSFISKQPSPFFSPGSSLLVHLVPS